MASNGNFAVDPSRTKLQGYFADPTPEHRIPHNADRVARLFAEGLSESEIVSKLRMSRDIVTKMLKVALEIANRPKASPLTESGNGNSAEIKLSPINMERVDSFLERARAEDAAWQNYCASKQETVEELKVSPEYVLGEPGAIRRVQEEIFFRTLEDAQKSATDRALTRELSTGSNEGFNKEHSTFASKEDALARSLQVDTELAGIVHEIAPGSAIDAQRSKRKLLAQIPGSDVEFEAYVPSPDKVNRDKLAARAGDSAFMGGLPILARQIVRMYAVDRLTYKEIQTQTGQSQAAISRVIKTAVSRAIRGQ